jgi:polyferredoxin
MSGEAVSLVLVGVSVALFGRLYCSVVCPLGIAQDVAHGPLRFLRMKKRLPIVGWIRYSALALFIAGAVMGFTGLVAPYGIFARFVTVGIAREGEPSAALVAWSVALFAFALLMVAFRARWWCNQICPVGTFLGIFSRFAVFRPRIDESRCVKCGLCARECDKGAIRVRDDRSVAIDHSLCIACFDCKGSCRKEALKWR